MFMIKKDHLATEPGDQYDATGAVVHKMPLYGLERAMGVDDDLTEDGPLVDFKLFDDDGELCYTGRLNDDSDYDNQTAALRWGETNAGCTYIQIKRGSEWVQEIG